jgi:hypothetical protein
MVIKYSIISDAITHFTGLGYEHIEVPWIISDEAIWPLTPKGKRQYDTFLGNLVASAEMSFFELIINQKIDTGKYLACTPCFRDENPTTELQKNYFMKVELIDIIEDEKQIDKKIKEILDHGESFFSRYLPIKKVDTEIGVDIFSKNTDIELGSYGYRQKTVHGKKYNWIYGTGAAEPRLSQCLELEKKGYHLTPIPRAQFNTKEKILEEYHELEDAVKQESKIMELIELSDMIGAIEGYLNNKFPDFKLDDLIKMKTITKRAFQNEIRK